MDEEVTLDSWTPNIPEKKLIPSKWRKEQNGENFNQEVGRDDLKKIKFCLTKKYPDHEIMKTFAITAQTLVAIKEGRINPGEGKMRGTASPFNDFDEINSLHKKISALQIRLYGINCAFRELTKILYADKFQQKEFLKLLDKKRGKGDKIDIEDD